MNKSIDTPDLRQASREAERRFLAGLWLNPSALDVAAEVNLCGQDFILDAHSFIYCYACVKHSQGMRPLIPECVRLAGENGIAFTEGDLADLVIEHHHRDRIRDYAEEVAGLSAERIAEEARIVTREAIRAINRGLRIEASWRAKKARRPYQNVRP